MGQAVRLSNGVNPLKANHTNDSESAESWVAVQVIRPIRHPSGHSSQKKYLTNRTGGL
jgi:hypothetical protein